MASNSLRRVMVFSLLGVFALAAVGLAGFWHPNAPVEAMRVYLPAITLPAVVVAALIDGINPCAFTVLLLFITALLATVQAGQQPLRAAEQPLRAAEQPLRAAEQPLRAAEQNLKAIRARVVGMGSIYIAAIFFTYLALGVGLLKSIDFFTRQHIPARLGALFAILFGLWMLKDFFLPDWGWRLQAPAWVGIIARRSAQKATVPALITGGFFIGLCTVPCSGAVYLGVLSLLALQPTALLGYSYLVLYNVIFVLPLVALLVAASTRPTLNRLAHWNLHHKEWIRLALGGGVAIMGLLILATV